MRLETDHSVYIYSKDSGGDGDCLFHSIAETINDITDDDKDSKRVTSQIIRDSIADVMLENRGENDPSILYSILTPLEKRHLSSVYRNEMDELCAELEKNPGNVEPVHARMNEIMSDFVRVPGKVWGNDFLLALVQQAFPDLGFVIFQNVPPHILCTTESNRIVGEKVRFLVMLYYFQDMHYHQAGYGRRGEVSTYLFADKSKEDEEGLLVWDTIESYCRE